MTELYIGIDPDLLKSGVATWDGKKFTQLGTMRFYELLDYLEMHKMHAWTKKEYSFMVFLEAGWLNEKSNFHTNQGAWIRERIAKDVGQNQAVGKLILEYCELEKINYHTIRPTQTKWSSETFKKITGWEGRTNSEMRDAARLIFGR